MATPGNAKIETTLRKTVRDALKNGEEVRVKRVRKRVEEKLDLEEDFLQAGVWKSKSKAIIQEEFQKPEEDAQQLAEKAKGSPAKPRKRSQKGDEQGNSASGRDGKAKDRTPKPPEGTAPKVNGVKRKAAEVEPTSRPENDGGASSADNNSEESPSKKAKAATPAPAEEDTASENATGSESETSTDGDDDSESGSSGSDGEEAQDTGSPGKTTQIAQEDSIQAIPSKTFKPPSGYTSVDSSLLSSNGSLTNSNLEGKQIWHVTAPSNVPLSSLTELALSSIQSDEAVLSHKNVPYVLSEDKTVGVESTALLTPTTQGYLKTQCNISRTLRLQQKIDLPNLSGLQASQMTGSNAAGDVAQASISTVRPQPKGLRMRFKPPGFGKGRPGRIGSGSESGDEEEDEETGPSFQFPETLGQHGVEARQKSGDVEMVDAAAVEPPVVNGDKSEKKSKKKRKEKAGATADNEAPSLNGHAVSKTAPDAAPMAETRTSANALPNGTGAEKESKEEKKRRKEEKRVRKEAKAEAKEHIV